MLTRSGVSTERDVWQTGSCYAARPQLGMQSAIFIRPGPDQTPPASPILWNTLEITRTVNGSVHSNLKVLNVIRRRYVKKWTIFSNICNKFFPVWTRKTKICVFDGFVDVIFHSETNANLKLANLIWKLSPLVSKYLKTQNCSVNQYLQKRLSKVIFRDFSFSHFLGTGRIAPDETVDATRSTDVSEKLSIIHGVTLLISSLDGTEVTCFESN